MKQYVIKVCHTVNYELIRFSSTRSYLTEDATKMLVTSCVLSRLDYCNFLLMGTPNSVIQPVKKVQNATARLLLRAPSHHNCTPSFSNYMGVRFVNASNTKLPACITTHSLVPPPLTFSSYCSITALSLSPLFIRHTHTQTPTLQPQNSWFSLFLLFRSL